MERSDFLIKLGQGLTAITLVPFGNKLLVEDNSDQNLNFDGNKEKLKISGVYPHLTVFNKGDEDLCSTAGGECGIGAIVPWKGKLWMVTYSPHCPMGSADKLYSIDENLNMKISPKSVGGTPANRMIHKETNQLIIGPYFIDQSSNVRVISPGIMRGRLTATARHLEDPANKVYFYDMEGKLYEVDVHSLEVYLLYKKPVPGWHGKGAYTAQNRLILANNGQDARFNISWLLKAGHTPKNKYERGILAEWDGDKKWNIVKRRQFTDITGPGGIYGSPNDQAPAWTIGWDRRSVMLMLLDDGKWYTYRLPKSTHTYDSSNGYYTEWPRIRSVSKDQWFLDMHGMFFDFLPSFDRSHTAGIRPVCNHLRIVPDYCGWQGKIVLATDETQTLHNPHPGQSQSNLWFGSKQDMREWGSTQGYGGPLLNDKVKAGNFSDPYLIGGFNHKTVHIDHDSDKTVTFTFEIDKKGHNNWSTYRSVKVGPNSYWYEVLPNEFNGEWVRVKTDKDCQATVYFHYTEPGHDASEYAEMFNGLADIDEYSFTGGLIRPAGHNRNLQYLLLTSKENIKNAPYYEVDEKVNFMQPENDRGEEVSRICALDKNFKIDEASVIVKDHSGTFRLPKTDYRYDHPFEFGWPRDKRMLESELIEMLNIHGTIFEVARESGLATTRPICTHKKRIIDYCTWRGLLVLSGTSKKAKDDRHYFSAEGRNTPGLWFGAIDDLWKLGKPVGEGGPWKDSMVKAGEPSLPYLMTGYDKKKVKLQSDVDAIFTLELDFDHHGWHIYKKIHVPAGKTVAHEFPSGFSAHWIRLCSNTDSQATAWFTYT